MIDYSFPSISSRGFCFYLQHYWSDFLLSHPFPPKVLIFSVVPCKNDCRSSAHRSSDCDCKCFSLSQVWKQGGEICGKKVSLALFSWFYAFGDKNILAFSSLILRLKFHSINLTHSTGWIRIDRLEIADQPSILRHTRFPLLLAPYQMNCIMLMASIGADLAFSDPSDPLHSAHARPFGYSMAESRIRQWKRIISRSYC